mgnify:CR=1 FL=1
MDYKLIALIIILLLGYAALCISEVEKAVEVRWFPKWVWLIITFISIPLGGIIFLLFGNKKANK